MTNCSFEVLLFSSIEKLRSWRTIQTAILAKLNTGEVDAEEDITVNHGFQVAMALNQCYLSSLNCFAVTAKLRLLTKLVFVSHIKCVKKLDSFPRSWQLQSLYRLQNIITFMLH